MDIHAPGQHEGLPDISGSPRSPESYDEALKHADEERVIADLFLDTIVDAPVKDDQRLMSHPFFSLSKRKRTAPIVYDDGNGNRIEITPGPNGIATIWDKDILMYAVSLVVDRLNRGMDVERTVQFNAYDLLKLTHRGTGGKSYELLFDALFRLRSTNIVTNIDSEKGDETRGFGWIDSFKIVTRTTTRGKKVMGAVEITLADWMWRSLQNYKTRVLTINRAYFKLTKGLERKLYELARRHCGRQPMWKISLEKLSEKCGTTRDLRHFKYDLKRIVQDNNLPDYTISLTFDGADRKRISNDFGEDAAWRWGSNERMMVTFAPRSAPAPSS